MMDNNNQTIEKAGFVIKMRRPEGEPPFPVMLMLHGWTGDENSMWIFAGRLPEDALLIAPRGIYPSPLGGYSWQDAENRRWPKLQDFDPALEALLALLRPQNFPEADFADLRAVGFSQGAALTYALALLHPDKLVSFGGMSGFLPGEVDAVIAQRPLAGKHAFVTHGTQDEMVDVQRAREAVEKLEQAGAQVTYCEDDVGHKLSLTCFKGLEAFFERY